MFDLDAALAVAIKAASSSGEILQSRFKTALTIRTKSSARDLVTEVDGLAQEAIIETILKDYPNHGFITEEVVGERHLHAVEKNKSSPYKWIIDPLDGTTNFTRGKKTFATMIALESADELLLGVISFPLKNQLFTGVKGGGAFCNGKPLKLRETKNMVDAILSTNMVARAAKDTKGVLQIATPYCASLHNYGCAAAELSAILQGENDGVFYDGVGLWDIAPGCLLIAEAGGKYCYTYKDHSDPRKGVTCVACTTPIFAELHTWFWPDELQQTGTHTR